MEPLTAATAPGLTYPQSLPPVYTIHPTSFLTANPHIRGLIASAVVFHPTSSSSPTSPPSPARILLLRRAPSESWPFLWCLPGGSVDVPDDASFAAAAARELREETGLHAASVLAAVCHPADGPSKTEQVEKDTDDDDDGVVRGPPGEWTLDDRSGLWTFIETGNVWAKAALVFALDTPADEENERQQTDVKVVLQPDEHIEAAWVTEEEVRNRQFRDQGGRLDIISEGVRQTLLEAFRLHREMNGWAERAVVTGAHEQVNVPHVVK